MELLTTDAETIMVAAEAAVALAKADLVGAVSAEAEENLLEVEDHQEEKAHLTVHQEEEKEEATQEGAIPETQVTQEREGQEEAR